MLTNALAVHMHEYTYIRLQYLYVHVLQFINCYRSNQYLPIGLDN